MAALRMTAAGGVLSTPGKQAANASMGSGLL